MRVHDVNMWGASSSSSTTGLLIDADGGDLQLSFDNSYVGGSSGSFTNGSMMVVDGDLSLTDSRIQGISLSYGSAYSNSCSYVGVYVSGDLLLTGSTVTGLYQSCSSWSHSALTTASLFGIDVAGDATLTDVELSDNDFSAYSSGYGATATGALLRVQGDLEASDLVIRDNRFVAEMDCYDYACYRTASGGSLVHWGMGLWDGGELQDNRSAWPASWATTHSAG